MLMRILCTGNSTAKRFVGMDTFDDGFLGSKSGSAGMDSLGGVLGNFKISTLDVHDTRNCTRWTVRLNLQLNWGLIT
jgi:hypothetical protein